ncbi:MAG TPA: N-acetylmuramoyl-L-alanine amidase [Spirochaetota bacterium]|nr:N-acetylmuramoyl-L-alanine amidase [Spirochaetota bacterium]HOK93657.1 N-acetylmuramoyl-L-alanine amidase [Spirochaetota bacterium]
MLKHTPYIIKIKRIIAKALFPLLLLAITGAGNDRLTVENINGNNYVSLYEIINKFNIESTFDPVFQKGRLYYKNHYLVYKPDYSVVIIDNSLWASLNPVCRYKSGIYLPEDIAIKLIESFFPEVILTKKNSAFEISTKVKMPEEKEKKYKEESITRDRIGFIIIDPGHGGKDPGAIGKGGIREKDITLQISGQVSQKLQKALSAIKIKETRKSDIFIELAERAEIANRELKKGINGIFVSIHVNASISNKISGFETYYLSQNPTNEEARKTAALENNVIVLEDKKGKKYDDTEYMEALMLTTQIQRESSLLAESVQRALEANIHEFKSKGVHRADFYVLRGALMPAVLVEVGFITNPKEAKYLTRRDYQEKISSAITEGILNFIKKYNKMIE